MKEEIHDLKQCFEKLYNHINNLRLTGVQEDKIYAELDKLEDLIAILDSLSDGVV